MTEFELQLGNFMLYCSSKNLLTKTLKSYDQTLNGGAHNSEEFFKNDIKIVSESPSKILGVKTVEYNMPKLNMDGTPTGEYGNKVFTKTIYDPKIISDKEFINRGIEAANDAKLKTSDGVLSREWTGVDSKEITWRGYHKGGEISSFFPE
ncbi:CdiA family toxin C-terminal domain-containing protein [Bacillus sp. SIMBA_074]|uniref:CdiA family toxin C-terminal domain-containing protein n=1 Tax=Bacillus TaxID=1386 RepID=UPI00397BDF50